MARMTSAHIHPVPSLDGSGLESEHRSLINFTLQWEMHRELKNKQYRQRQLLAPDQYVTCPTCQFAYSNEQRCPIWTLTHPDRPPASKTPLRRPSSMRSSFDIGDLPHVSGFDLQRERPPASVSSLWSSLSYEPRVEHEPTREPVALSRRAYSMGHQLSQLHSRQTGLEAQTPETTAPLHQEHNPLSNQSGLTAEAHQPLPQSRQPNRLCYSFCVRSHQLPRAR